MAALLWVVWDGIRFWAAIVTSISAVNGRKQCVIVACGGDGLTDWLPLITKIESNTLATKAVLRWSSSAGADGSECSRITGPRPWC